VNEASTRVWYKFPGDKTLLAAPPLYAHRVWVYQTRQGQHLDPVGYQIENIQRKA